MKALRIGLFTSAFSVFVFSLILALGPSANSAVTVNASKTGVSAISWQDGGTLSISGGGTLAGTTTYNRYAVLDKMLLWQWKFEQTSPGSGGASTCFGLPGGLTAADKDGVGFAHVNDWLNGNETNGMHGYISSNEVCFRTVEQGSFLDLLGSHWTGNANVNFIAANLVIELN